MKCITNKFTKVINEAVAKAVAEEITNQEYDTQLAVLERKVDEFGEEANNRIEEVDSNVQDLDSKVDDMESTVSDLSDKVDNIESAEYVGTDYLDDKITELENELSDKVDEAVANAIDERKIEIAKEQVDAIVKEQVKVAIKEAITKEFILSILAAK